MRRTGRTQEWMEMLWRFGSGFGWICGASVVNGDVFDWTILRCVCAEIAPRMFSLIVAFWMVLVSKE